MTRLMEWLTYSVRLDPAVVIPIQSTQHTGSIGYFRSRQISVVVAIKSGEQRHSEGRSSLQPGAGFQSTLFGGQPAVMIVIQAQQPLRRQTDLTCRQTQIQITIDRID